LQVQKAKQGYKLVKSLFGRYEEIPEEWEIKKIEDLFEFLRTGSNSRSDLERSGDVQYIHYGDIHTKWKSILDCDSEEIPWISKAKVENLPLLKDGDIIIVDASEDYEGSGTSILIKNIKDKKIVSGLHTLALRSKDENISLDFNAYLTSIKFVKNQIIGYVTGISVYGLSKNNLKKIKIPLPPFKEQHKIATILSNVDNLLQSYDKVIESTKKLKKGLMQQLLTKGIGHTKFKKIRWLFRKKIKIPENWKEVKLKNLTNKIGDGIHSTPNYVDESDFYFINGNNLVDGSIVFFDSTKNVDENEYLKYKLDLNQNTILLSINGTIGNVSFYNNEKIVLGKSACYINCNEKLNNKFLYYVLKSNNLKKYFRRELTGTTIFNLSLESIRNSPILLPKKEEQQQIVSILSEVDSRIRELEQTSSYLESLKKGLLQKLLTGQIRVKV